MKALKWLSIWSGDKAVYGSNAAVGLRSDGHCLYALGRDQEDAMRNLHCKLTIDANQNFIAEPLTPEEIDRVIAEKGPYRAAS